MTSRQVRDQLFAFGKKWLYTFLIKKIFGAAIGGIKGFVAQWIFDKFWNKVAKPLLQKGWRKTATVFRRWDKTKKAKKLEDAKTKTDFESGVDDLP